MKKILSFFAAMLVAVAANAAVINITPTSPESSDNLRHALNSAADGDEIVMAAGTYVESNGNYIAFDGKAVTVKAAEGAEVIIQPQVPITVSNGGHAIFENVKIDASRLTELADWYEHLLYVTDENPNGCTFRGCELYGFNLNKSMFYCNATNKVAAMKFENCYFHDLMKSIIFVENTAGKPMLNVKNCTFENIIAPAVESYYAGVIDIRAAEATLQVDHCTFYNVIPMNTDYSAVSKITLAKGTVSNCIFMLPTAQDGIRAMRGVTAKNCITFNYLKDDGTGIHSSVTQTNCIQQDPKFVNAAEGNFTLGEGSPALTLNDGEPIGDPRWVPAPAEPLMKKIYCKMDKDWWKVDGAAVGCYIWDDGGNPKVAWPGERMTPVEGETDLWSVELDINTYHMCIFTRVNGTGDIADWGAKTADLTIPTDEKDMFTITNNDPTWGDPGCTGAWSKYEPAPQPQVDKTVIYVAFPSENRPEKIEVAGTFDAGKWGMRVFGGDWYTSDEDLYTSAEDVLKFRDADNNDMILCQYIPANGGGEGKWEQVILKCSDFEVTNWKGEMVRVIEEVDLSNAAQYAWKEGMPEPGPVADEWVEIKFAEAATADEIAEDASYTVPGTEFTLTLHDEGNKMAIDANDCRFGTAEAYTMYNFRIKSGGASSSTKNYFTLNIPEAGTLRLAPRTGSNSDETRALVIAQGETELYNAVVKEPQAIEVQEGDNTVKVYPYVEVAVAAGEVRVSYTAGMNFYAFAFKAEEEETPTAIESNVFAVKAVKMIENGQLVIIRNGKKFNVQGQVIR